MSVCAIASAASLFAQSYQVVVTTTDGERKVFATDDVSDIKFKNAPKYTEANTFIEGTYSPSKFSAVYSIVIGTEEPDSEGQPSFVGGMQLGLSLTAPLSEEASKAVLPEGYYRASSSNDPFTIAPIASALWLRYSLDEDGVTVGFVLDGTVDVRHDGENYDLRAEIDLIDGSHVDLSYYGKMQFRVTASGTSDFEEDQNVKFTEGQGRIWANWFEPFADDGSLQFFTGKFDENNRQTEGYALMLPFYTEKSDEHTPTWKPVVPDGVYNVDERDKVISQSYRPFTLHKGAIIDVFGDKVQSGSYLTYLAPDGNISLAMITGGKMTVSENGAKFDFDFTTNTGIKVTGSYDGKPYLVNMIDNSRKPEFQDDLTGDYELSKFPENAVVLDYDLGDYIVPGLKTHVVMFTDPEMKKGDYLMLEIFSDSEKELKDGAYTFDNSLLDMSGIKGVVTYQGAMNFSWYGDLDSTDDEGYQTVLAPISGGTMTVSTEANGDRKFVFDLLDLKGNKITGSITKPVYFIKDQGEENFARMERNAARTLGTVKRTWGTRDTTVQPRVLMPRK